MEDLRELLAAGERTTSWLAHLASARAPDVEVSLPAPDDLAPALLELAVPHEDIGDLVALRPDRRHTPDLWWLVERSAWSLVSDMGAVDGPPPFPPMPEALGPLHRYFHVYVLLAALPSVRAFHSKRGIPDGISRLTLADLGRNMAVHRRRYGMGGLDMGPWLMRHFRGLIYQLGRLQFERARLGTRTGNAVAAIMPAYGPGSQSLEVHVPEFFGPLSPRACDASFTHAREFFDRYFPEEAPGVAACHSWLLDAQLAEYLPETSNIMRFQRRFRPAYQYDEPHDEDIQRFVFGRVASDLAELAGRTTLERAVIDHLRMGRHWTAGAGWLLL